MKPLYFNNGLKITMRINEEGYKQYNVINEYTLELITYFYSLSEAKNYCREVI